MTGRLNEPGLLTIEFDGQEPRTYKVTAGPWRYAQQLCWITDDGKEQVTYAPWDAVLTWSKQNGAET